MTSTRGGRRALILTIVGLGLAIGAAKGGYALWRAPEVITPQQHYTMLFSNVAFWTSWAVLGLAVIAVGRRVPLSGPRKGLRTPAAS